MGVGFFYFRAALLRSGSLLFALFLRPDQTAYRAEVGKLLISASACRPKRPICEIFAGWIGTPKAARLPEYMKWMLIVASGWPGSE